LRTKPHASARQAHNPLTDGQSDRKCLAPKGTGHGQDGGAAIKQPQRPTKPHTSAVPPKPQPSSPDTDDMPPPPQTVSPFSPTLWTVDPTLNPFTTAEIKRFSQLIAKLDQPPKFLIPIYKAAGKRFYHIPWQILAAINAVETNYGRDLRVSAKGAIGWMQFMPATWMQYGMAVDGYTVPNPYNPRDAIFSAARYLAANGAPKHMRKALFAYNHARWYVDAVLWRAQVISDHALKGRHGKHGYALPLDGPYMRQLGRTDDGVDIEDAPDGAAVYSIAPGKVTAVASDPTGFGPNYPVIRVTKGPLAGQYIYYGHVAASLVHLGQNVIAGQPIAVMGHTGDAASLGHGHIEIGFSDALGDPLNHHGAVAWTPSGDAMRHVLIALSAAFKIKDS
jgi:murein DD-endopeptidase MepM/ murein hydrolase activator NlpD